MRTLGTSLVLLLLAACTYGQISIMPKAGVSLSNLSVSDEILYGSPKPDSKIGLVVGAAFEISVLDMLSIQPELLFVQKGAIQEYSGAGYSETDTWTINYLELPVLLKVKFGRFYVGAGPSISYGIGGKYKEEWNYQGDAGEDSADIKFGEEPDGNETDWYFDNALDMGALVGAGAKVGPIVIDARYGMGLSNMNDEPDGFSGDWKIKNTCFQFTVGFPIPMGN